MQLLQQKNRLFEIQKLVRKNVYFRNVEINITGPQMNPYL